MELLRLVTLCLCAAAKPALHSRMQLGMCPEMCPRMIAGNDRPLRGVRGLLKAEPCSSAGMRLTWLIQRALGGLRPIEGRGRVRAPSRQKPCQVAEVLAVL